MTQFTHLGLAILLVIINGFFVAAEFALVKVRPTQIKDLVKKKRPFAKAASWLFERLEQSLSACQLGITMASLALGWVGEPAFAKLLEPVLHWLGVESNVLVHTIAFIIAFTTITALHLVIGEQAPKIYAIRRPEQMLLWCAFPLKWFCILSYPLMTALNVTTSVLLKRVGLKGSSEHGTPLDEHELRVLLHESHAHGHLTPSEHHLIDAVFEFDDMICRQIMVPRGDVDYFDVALPSTEFFDLAKRTKHTRYPVCEGSLDEVLGVIHLKDLFGLSKEDEFDWKKLMRPPKKVSEYLPISKLLRHFQSTHQLLAFVVDEYGMVIGIVTLENVLEQIIGEVADEFDTETPDIVPDGPGQWIVKGSTPLDEIADRFYLETEESEAHTFSGWLMEESGQLPSPGDTFLMSPVLKANILEVRDDRAYQVRITEVGSEATLDMADEEETN